MAREAKRTVPWVKYICRECGVQVISKTNKRAIFGKEHSKKCSRRFK